MYNKDIESKPAKNAEHQNNLKKAASERLAKNAKWKRDNKSKAK